MSKAIEPGALFYWSVVIISSIMLVSISILGSLMMFGFGVAYMRMLDTELRRICGKPKRKHFWEIFNIFKEQS